MSKNTNFSSTKYGKTAVLGMGCLDVGESQLLHLQGKLLTLCASVPTSENEMIVLPTSEKCYEDLTSYYM